MLNALIIAFITFVLWKLTPIVFDMVERRKRFMDAYLKRRIEVEHKKAKEDAEAMKKAEDEYQEHLKKVQESVGHQGRVQYPWVSGMRNICDATTEKDLDKVLEDIKHLKKRYEEEGP